MQSNQGYVPANGLPRFSKLGNKSIHHLATFKCLRNL